MSQANIDVSRLNETVREESLQVQAALAEMRKVIVGQRSLLDRMMVALLCRGHLLVEGVPWLAKTLTVKTLVRDCSAGSGRRVSARGTRRARRRRSRPRRASPRATRGRSTISGVIRLERGDEAGARAAFARASAADPRFHASLLHLARWLGRQGRRDEALQALAEAEARRPGDPDVAAAGREVDAVAGR